MRAGEFIAKQRQRMNLSLSAFADLITSNGYLVTKSTVAHWENYRSNPPMQNERFVDALALSLGMSVEQLVNESLGKRDYSEQAAYAATLVDHMNGERQKIAIGILEKLVELP